MPPRLCLRCSANTTTGRGEGRAQKIIFVARCLRLRELQREIQEGLNVVESSNGAGSVIFLGEGGDIATNRREELEMSVMCLRILQAALVYINRLMLPDVLADPEWAELLKPADRRGLTPLFWQHVQPYGEVRLDVAKRLPLGGARAAQPGGGQWYRRRRSGAPRGRPVAGAGTRRRQRRRARLLRGCRCETAGSRPWVLCRRW